MQRRSLLSSLVGGTVIFSGCASNSFLNNTTEVYNPTGLATIRPLDTPIMQHGLTKGSEQYLYARMFHPGDTLAVTDRPDTERYAEAIDDLSEREFAVFTNIRTAAAAPAYFWPANAEWKDGRLEIILERQTNSYDGTGDEVVGVALTKYSYEGNTPTGADIIYPSGATTSVGHADQ